jgi:hypothetical protein
MGKQNTEEPQMNAEERRSEGKKEHRVRNGHGITSRLHGGSGRAV